MSSTTVAFVALLAGVFACTSARPRHMSNGEVADHATFPSDAPLPIVRIALISGLRDVHVTAEGAWGLYAADGRTVLAMADPGETLQVRRDGRGFSAERHDARRIVLQDTTIIARASDASGMLEFNSRRWRGELVVTRVDGLLLVVNRLSLDDYVRGVVPLEIGTNAIADLAAVEAQAVAARSYAVSHLASSQRRYDMFATVADQVFGGASAETDVGNAAVTATTGLVLRYANHPVNAPYHANCGGSTAEPEDAWHTGPEPYLMRVSDRIPGTSRFYCDQAPNFRWTRTFDASGLRHALSRYIQTLPGSAAPIGVVRDVVVSGVTPAGRVQTLVVDTERRRWVLRGGDIRAALRAASGELLYSTYFSVDAVHGRDGVQRLTLFGGGNGHGVGMCQAGAIGRARAGQDFRTILQTYYPGTTVGPIE